MTDISTVERLQIQWIAARVQEIRAVHLQLGVLECWKFGQFSRRIRVGFDHDAQSDGGRRIRRVSHIAYYTTGVVVPVAVPAQSCSDQTFTVSGLVAADNLGSIQPPAALGNVSVGGYASSPNTVTFHFCNASTSSVVPPAGAYTFLAMH